ncbi:MAG TPA: PLP-dependent aminotransferase family protein [Caldisericia bacterium]|nr:PLP-dependent aminotransferase family protein [Caldisericia bacterium]HQH49298.1 PLP-dependent aminotransferase family protein [Caldisericia bacterium]HQJ43712.1 PLP-dependent aminotransferase family protein [Caldisericia bacterium]
MDWNFASRTNRMKGSVIRELLALTQKPEIISFAGGLPDPTMFPVEQFNECMSHVIKTIPSVVFQYGETPGYKPLREIVVEMTKKEGIKDCTIDNVCITTASQQGIELVGKIMVDEGDVVIVEGPTYLATLQAWSVYGAKYVTVDLDDEGMKVDELEERLEAMKKVGVRPKMIYTIPTFQNPAGVTMTLARRKKLLELAYKYNVPIIEDNPYGDLRFTGTPTPSLYSLDTKGMVVSLKTFSKILAPGLRLGWIVANKDFIAKICMAKQSADLNSPVITQAAVVEFAKRGYIDQHVPKICEAYGKKRQAMEVAMKQYLPQGVKWTNAEGGMFIWVTLSNNIDTTALFPKAIEHKVAYIVGSAFYPYGGGESSMRLNFSFPSLPQIDEGIKRLGDLIKSI